MLLLKISLSFFLLFSFQSQSSLFSLSPFSFLQKIHPKRMYTRFTDDRTNTFDPSLNESLDQDMKDDFIADKIINSQKKHKKMQGKPSFINCFSFLHKMHPKRMYTRFTDDRTNTFDPSLNESLDQDMKDDFIADKIINSQKKHKKERLIECRICKKMINGHSSLIHHFKNKHSKKKIYKCTFCHESLNNRFMLNQHYKRNCPQAKFRCKLCEQRSEENDLLDMKNIEKNSPSHTENLDREFFDISSLSIKELGLNNEEIGNPLENPLDRGTLLKRQA